MSTKDGSSRVFTISDERTTIGSKAPCDLHIPIPTLAPIHFEMTINDETISLLNRSPECDARLNNVIVQSAFLKMKINSALGKLSLQ